MTKTKRRFTPYRHDDEQDDEYEEYVTDEAM
jgi:hypothetical protein